MMADLCGIVTFQPRNCRAFRPVTAAASQRSIRARLPQKASRSWAWISRRALGTWGKSPKALARAGKVKPDERVVCLITGNGLKDIASARKAAGEPTPMEASFDSALAALARLGL